MRISTARIVAPMFWYVETHTVLNLSDPLIFFLPFVGEALVLFPSL